MYTPANMPVNTILPGDCLSVLKQLPDNSIDLIVTDPAYWTLNKWRNVGTTTRLGGHRDKSKQDKSKWFDCIQPKDLPDLVQECYRILKPNTHCYIMCDFETLKALYYASVVEGVFPIMKSGGVPLDPCKPLILKELVASDDYLGKIADWLSKFASDILENRTEFTSTTFLQNAEILANTFLDDLDIGKQYQTLVWDKLAQGMGYSYRARHEYIFLLYKGPKRRRLNSNSIPDVLEYKRIPYTQASVPTQKPVELFETLIQQSSNEGDVVLDPFMGSGSVGIAASNLGRNYIGVELAANNIKIAEQRITDSKKEVK